MKIFYICLVGIFQVCQSLNIQPNIIIIGAGPSGIAAATYLWEHNFTNIKILEAENRIGGRIDSVKFGDGYVDLGAQWCHGEVDNIVYEKAKNLDVLAHKEGRQIFFHSSRIPINEELRKDLVDIRNQIQLNLRTSAAENKTTGEFYLESYNELINKKFGEDKNNLKIAHDALDYFQLLTISDKGSFSWFDSAAKNGYTSCEGDLHLNWKGRGYKTILEILLKQYPDRKDRLPVGDKIIFNKEVDKIIWTTDDSETQVICTDKSIYTADHVIFTPSIGVLKNKIDTLFEPDLPEKKKEAISNIGIGAAMKVWMHYPEPWWKNFSNREFTLIWDANDVKSVAEEFPYGPQLNGRSWLTYMSDFLREEHNPTVLRAWFAGPLVPEIEKLPKDLIKDGLFYIMNKFLGHKFVVTKPEEIITSQWYNNPHFQGTYSFQTLKTCPKQDTCAEIDLAEPLTNSKGYPVIQFAGEATHLHYYSTVHGAIETGYREAKRLVDLYK